MMADFLGLQQPPTKKFRSGTNTNESDFEFNMLSQYETTETGNTQDLFGLTSDYNETIETNTSTQNPQANVTAQPQPQPQPQPQMSVATVSLSTTVNSNSSTAIYPGQQTRVTYIPQARAQLTSYQTPNLQRIQTMPTNSTIVRATNVISNGIQQQATVYTQQQQQQQLINSASGLNRSLYQRMPTAASSTLIRQPYPNATMVNVNQNVPQMSIVKTSDPNNNNLFVSNAPSQQQSTLIGLPQTVSQTPTVQTAKAISTVSPSVGSQQQQQIGNSVQTYNQASTNYLLTTHSQSSNSSGSSTNSNSTHTETQRKQFIQKQLVLLLHAHKCQQREKQTLNGEGNRTSSCQLPHCSTMKNVLQHMGKCNDLKTCTYPHCVTSRQIILHWKQCSNPQCPICQPLKTPSNSAKLTAVNASAASSSAIAPASSTAASATTISTSSHSNGSAANVERSVNKEWQKRVTNEVRNHLVRKIITALVPITDSNAMRDKRIVNLATYAQRVEQETFEIANNQEEYFHKLAEKIYKIQKELEDRREKKRQQEMQLTGQINTNASSQDFSDRPMMETTHSASFTEHSSSTQPSVTLINSNRTMFNGTNSNATMMINNGEASTSTQQIEMIDGQSQVKTEFVATKIALVKKEESLIPDEKSHLNISSASSTVIIKGSDPTTAAAAQQEENKPKIAPIDSSSKQLPKIPVHFTAEELRQHLEPVIEKMIACEDSHPFRQPVDPVALNILDYPTIIKRPMDISTMQNKLTKGEYQNPLEFCDDAWLMFNNAWLYNKKTTRVYKMCSKLSEVFAEAIDPVMQKLGYCCGRQYFYLPQVMFCYGNQLCCQIARDANYYYYNNPEPSRFNLSGDKYTFCAKCFDSVKNDSIFVGDDPAQTLVELPKSHFVAAKNDIQEPEVMLDCIVCTRRWHQVCALHLDQIWPEGFICETCLRQHNIKRKTNRYTALKLAVTDLARVLEKRVNDFLKNEGCQTGRVTIRILAASDKVCEVKPRMKKYYQNQVPDGFPYRTKAIFAFQEIDGVDVVLFGMHVQEYDGRCASPNTRRVYVSYLDSVHFFRPKTYRTDVYHEILIGYLDYAKQLGYVYAHIWACPPSEGDDYIFHCHPPEQRVPKPKRLQDWYKKMLDRAILERVVIDYKDVMKDCLDNQVQSALQIPYFEGDFWANIMEESIKELDQEEEERRKKEEVEAARAMEDTGFDDPIEPEDPTDISDKRKSANTHKKKNLKKTATQRKVAKKQMSNCTDLISKIFSTMEKHKEAFFVIRLRNPIAACPPVNDTDALIQCDLMDTRDAFLNFARDKHYEFSSLRRARFSTMALLYELHTSTSDKFTYNCNACRQQCEIRYHCTVCEDFDLCEKCYNHEPKHEHRMERSVPSIVDVSHDSDPNSSNSQDKSLASSQIQRQQSMQRCIEALLHAVNCRNANCVNRSCFRYKRVIQHTKECKGKNSQCNVCKQVIFLCWYHAKTCAEQNCQVPFCTNLKTKIQKQRATSLQTDRRRMQAMMQQRASAMQSAQPTQLHSIAQIPSQSQQVSIPANLYDSSGKPAPVTLIRAPQQTAQQVWTNQTYITVAQKPTNGKPMQQSSSPLSLLIGRVKQDPSIEDQQQRTDLTETKQLIYQPLINKAAVAAPVHRLPSQTGPTTTFIQQSGQVQTWHTSASQPQLNPPSYSTATRLRHPTLIQPAGQNSSNNTPSSHTLLAPLRSNNGAPTGTYIARTSSTPNLTRAPLNVTLIRPSQFPSPQPPSQDPSTR